MTEDGAGVEAFLRGEDRLSSSSFLFACCRCLLPL